MLCDSDAGLSLHGAGRDVMQRDDGAPHAAVLTALHRLRAEALRLLQLVHVLELLELNEKKRPINSFTIYSRKTHMFHFENVSRLSHLR